MPVRVHHPLEIIQIKEHQAHLFLFRSLGIQQTVQVAMQIARVMKTGDIIGHRQAALPGRAPSSGPRIFAQSQEVRHPRLEFVTV